jgi:hypothetical protein
MLPPCLLSLPLRLSVLAALLGGLFFQGAATPNLLSSTIPVALVQKKQSVGKKKEKRSKSQTPPPLIWEDRGALAQLDLYWGIGAESQRPVPPFQFLEEDFSGTNPKIKLLDAVGTRWNVKFDEEVQAEAAASRIAWACGYLVEENYFLPRGRVEGVTRLRRARRFVARDGSFTNALFEKRPANLDRRRIHWTWEENPFRGTRPLSGLILLSFLLSNWDTKPENNNVLRLLDPKGRPLADWYLITDWGATFGRADRRYGRSKWDVRAFARQPFLDRVEGELVHFRFKGKMATDLRSLPRPHVEWFLNLVGQLQEGQLRDAFRAAGATPTEIEGFSTALLHRIETLRNALPAPSPASATRDLR